jgi:hypothetical protein
MGQLTMLGYRKLIVVLFAMTYGFVLGLASKLTPEFATIVSITVASYMGANAFNKKAGNDGHGA